MATVIMKVTYWYGYYIIPFFEDSRYSVLERLLDECFIADMYNFILFFISYGHL